MLLLDSPLYFMKMKNNPKVTAIQDIIEEMLHIKYNLLSQTIKE